MDAAVRRRSCEGSFGCSYTLSVLGLNTYKLYMWVRPGNPLGSAEPGRGVIPYLSCCNARSTRVASSFAATCSVVYVCLVLSSCLILLLACLLSLSLFLCFSVSLSLPLSPTFFLFSFLLITLSYLLASQPWGEGPIAYPMGIEYAPRVASRWAKRPDKGTSAEPRTGVGLGLQLGRIINILGVEVWLRGNLEGRARQRAGEAAWRESCW
ncbi:hypothetical protein LZ30DRAFT_734384 [Colletotrichum cereale]|nr:hypothetical protein LZ30DRAFT_734384 [Colletotrichum cereale]